MKFILVSLALLSVVSCQWGYSSAYIPSYYDYYSPTWVSPYYTSSWPNWSWPVSAYDWGYSNWSWPVSAYDWSYSYYSWPSYYSDLVYSPVYVYRKLNVGSDGGESGKQAPVPNAAIMKMAPVIKDIERLKLDVFKNSQQDMSEYRSSTKVLDLTQVNNQKIAKILLLEELLSFYISKNVEGNGQQFDGNSKSAYYGDRKVGSKIKARKSSSKNATKTKK